MSHIPQRKEKDCLNCGATVLGRYCQSCGQENVIPKETFWHMVTHFFYDVTHFDSQFFHTVHHLILKPGFLSNEYIRGRRNNYLHPIRMYVFTSAIFFLLFFSIFRPKEKIETGLDTPLTKTERIGYIKNIQDALKVKAGNTRLLSTLAMLEDTTRTITNKDMMKAESSQLHITFGNKQYRTLREYDSVQHALPDSLKDGWFTRRMIKKAIAINEKYSDRPNEAGEQLAESLLHRLPYMLFISLPLFALILKLVYFRRKQFFYAEHGVFTIHLYVFTFLLLMAIFGLNALEQLTGWGILYFIIALLVIALFFYLYKAMRNFYGQRRGKTFLKFLLVAFSSFIMMLILFAVFFFFSAFTL